MKINLIEYPLKQSLPKFVLPKLDYFLEGLFSAILWHITLVAQVDL